MSAGQPATASGPALQLSRWTVTSGSNVQSRGAVVIEAGSHHWRASAEGNGTVDALLKAVDAALAEGPEAEGLVIVAVQPPAGEAPRSSGLYNGKARSTNIIAASIEAYVEALNAMLAEAHWAGAAETAGRGRRKAAPETHGRRGELDDAEADHGAPWFDR